MLVEIDTSGTPVRLAVLYATLPEFAEAAVASLSRARWVPTPNRFQRTDVWFYYRAVYGLDPQPPNQSPEPTAPAVTSPAPQEPHRPSP